jgi:DNA-binding MarR family transcriptional regulator
MANHEESLGRLISILYRTGQSYIGRRLEPYGIGSGQFAFLAELLKHDGVSQDDLAVFFRCDKATVARALQQLESRAYVRREHSPADGRVNLVYVTDQARAFEPVLFEILSEWTETLARKLSITERSQAFELLDRMVDNASAALGSEKDII